MKGTPDSPDVPLARRSDDEETAGNQREGDEASGDTTPAGAERVLRAGRAVHLLRAGRQGDVLRRRACEGLWMQVAAATAPVASRDGSVSETLWLALRESIRGFVGRRVSNPADVDDIVQWVFLRMHRSLGEVRNRERVHAWLYSTARRAVADYYRSASRRRELPAGDALDLDGLRPGSTGAEEDADQARREVASCLAPVVERLSSRDRDAIVLTEIRGLRLADAAANAGMSLSGMKSRVQRARRRLRRAMLDCCRVVLDARGVPTACVERRQTTASCRTSAAREE